MANVSNGRAYYGLQATATVGEFDTTGTAVIGPGSSVVSLDSDKGYSLMIEVDGSGNSAAIQLLDGSTSASGSGVAQVETATAAGTIGTSGNATVVVTGDDITGSPITLSVAVTSGDAASVWAGKVRTALNANAAITSKYTVGGSTTAITLTRTSARYNDSTLNISLDNGTCTGITTAATSANTTAGVNPSRALRLTGETFNGTDYQGSTIGDTQSYEGLLVRKIAGSSSNFANVTVNDGTQEFTLKSVGGFGMIVEPVGLASNPVGVTFSPGGGNGYSKLYVTVLATAAV